MTCHLNQPGSHSIGRSAVHAASALTGNITLKRAEAPRSFPAAAAALLVDRFSLTKGLSMQNHF
jgi:hypothetical protein